MANNTGKRIREMARVRDALSYIRPSDWDICLEMGRAIRSEFGEEGFEIWDTWVRQGGWFGERATWEKPVGYIEPNDHVGPPEGWRPSDGDWWSGER
jgi:hypothetical protein